MRTSVVVVSSTLIEKAVSETWRILKPAVRARCMNAAASLVSHVTVSKKASCRTFIPAFANDAAIDKAWEWTLFAILFRPFGPCQIPYIPAMFASST